MQDGIRVHADKIGVLGGVDARVDAVRFPSVFLVEQRNGHPASRSSALPNADQLPAGQLPPDGPVHLAQMEGLRHQIAGAVLGAVVYDDDLIDSVVQVHQGPNGLHDGDLLVIGRDNHTDGDIVVVVNLIAQTAFLGSLKDLVAAHDDGGEEERGIAHQIDDKKDLKKGENRLHEA